MKEYFIDTVQQLPLVREPDGDKSAEGLKEYIRKNHKELLDKMYKHGAILFRGFNISTPKLFEEISALIDPDLKNDYLGTSPRDKVPGTDYVFSASELPGFYPIPQHCEMSYMKNKPVKLFFWCNVEPEYGGETPLCNFRKVYNELDEEVKREFEKRKIKLVRNYSAPGKRSKFNLWELKNWTDIFHTSDKKEVEKQFRKYEVDFAWKENGNLRLTHINNAVAEHPVTKEKVWFNHTQVFNIDAAPIEYEFIHQRQKRLKTLLVKWMISAMVGLKKMTTNAEDVSVNMVFADGTEIPEHYIRNIEETIWKNMVIFPWKKNDMVAIDNLGTAHGRLPYEGRRQILVCWSE